jgi:hypothetical protein
MKFVPHPDAWTAATPGMQSCFHQAFSRWALFSSHGEHGWRIAVGIVRGGMEGTDNVHAWLQDGARVVSAVTGEAFDRAGFYRAVGVDARTVRLINPRKILRRAKAIDRDAVKALLDAWGGRYTTTPTGGIVAG